MYNLSIALHENAKNYPNKKALVSGDQSVTFQELEERVNKIACWLTEHGIQQGDRIAISCPNLPYFPMLYYSILKVGAIVVPLNILLSADEIEYHLNDCGAKAYFCFEGSKDLPIGEKGLVAYDSVSSCQQFISIGSTPAGRSDLLTLDGILDRPSESFYMALTEPSDTAVILYTSGTTGRPKGAELSHMNLFMNAWQFTQITQSTHDDVHLIVLPLFHTFGQTAQMNTGMLMGNTLVVMPRFEPELVFDTLIKEKVTLFCGVPTMYWGLLNHQAEPQLIAEIADTLRLCCAGGASLPIEILSRFEAQFKVPIIEGYGLSETAPIATYNRIDQERFPGSVGTPLWGVDVKVTDEQRQEVPQGEAGEVAIRGHNVMKGYYNRPEATAESIVDGWFYTGDVGRFDEYGNLYLVDRVKDMIIRGGYNVYPRELEEVMLTHPEISLVSVVGIPNDKFGEEVKAFVILNEGATVDEAALIEWCKAKMAGYKYPRYIEIRDSLPMTATGKILKRELRAQSQQ